MKNPNGVIELLIEIKQELEIQLAKKSDREIVMVKILQLSELMPNRLINSGIDRITAESLLTLCDSFFSNATTHSVLQSHLNDVNKFLGH